MKKKSATFFSLFISLILVFLLSCEEFDTDSMKLTNNTSQMTYYLAMTVEESHLVDLMNPIGSVSGSANIISRGETALLHEENIWGYTSRDDIRFFFYEVIGDSAYMSGSLDITHKQLQKLRSHVVIDDEELTTRYE